MWGQVRPSCDGKYACNVITSIHHITMISSFSKHLPSLPHLLSFTPFFPPFPFLFHSHLPPSHPSLYPNPSCVRISGADCGEAAAMWLTNVLQRDSRLVRQSPDHLRRVKTPKAKGNILPNWTP